VVDDLYPGARIGMVYTVHPSGHDLGFKPHVHLVMTKGGLKDGEWVEIDGVRGSAAPSQSTFRSVKLDAVRFM